MDRVESYHCWCGWSRIVLDGETLEDAKVAHVNTVIHKISARKKRGRASDVPTMTTLPSGVRRTSVTNYRVLGNDEVHWVLTCSWCGQGKPRMYEYGYDEKGRVFCDLTCWRSYWGR